VKNSDSIFGNEEGIGDVPGSAEAHNGTVAGKFGELSRGARAWERFESGQSADLALEQFQILDLPVPT
jgi:hypothetical protein